MYRMVAKTKANRLKQILHQIISLTQSAVILIIDNTLFGINVSKKIRCNKSKKKKELVALKLDISKVQWNRGFVNKLWRD